MWNTSNAAQVSVCQYHDCGDIPPPLESMTIDCLGDGFASVIPDLPEGYTWSGRTARLT